MKTTRLIRVFHDRYPFIGPAMWMLSVQYFLTQIVVANAWSNPYSLSANTISDLGNTACGVYGLRYVCSPDHGLMNISFITLGVFMSLGSVLIYQEFKKSRFTLLGFSLLASAGIGTIFVGLFPENTVGFLHELGAFLPFFFGNVGIIVLGRYLRLPRSLAIYSVVSGAVSLIALLLFISNHYLGLGIGGMERITAYPQTVWLMVFGLYISRNRLAGHLNNQKGDK